MMWKIARRKYFKKLDREEKYFIKLMWKEAFKELKEYYITGCHMFSYSQTRFPQPDLLAEKIKKFLKRKRINFTFEKTQYNELSDFYYKFHFEQK